MGVPRQCGDGTAKGGANRAPGRARETAVGVLAPSSGVADPGGAVGLQGSADRLRVTLELVGADGGGGVGEVQVRFARGWG